MPNADRIVLIQPGDGIVRHVRCDRPNLVEVPHARGRQEQVAIGVTSEVLRGQENHEVPPPAERRGVRR